MRFKNYILLLFVLPLFAFSLHKYYVSLCEIEYVKDQKSVQIILGMFIDDIELTLNKNYQKELKLATKNEVENVDTYYLEYLQEHFKISINKSEETYTFIGKEYEHDIVRFYLEITDVQELKSLQITNNSLFRDFKDQKNIIKIKVNDFHKTFYLTKKNDKGLLNL
jgi:hypothetical protein